MQPSPRHAFALILAGAGSFIGVAQAAPTRDRPPAALYDTYTGFAIPAESVLPPRETHPSLWFSPADLPALRSRCTGDDFGRSRWAAVQRLATLGTKAPAPPAATDKVEAIHQYYGSQSIAARVHAVLSLLADDEAVRLAHLHRAQELLLRAYDGPIYQLDSSEKGSAVDEIYRGSWLQNYAHAYDCIQPMLDADTDRRIRQRLAAEAQCVHDHLYLWTPTSPHNHLSKPAWGLGSMALALSSHPQAKAWLARAIEAANKNTRYFFSGDGLYREGSHYLVFSLTNFLPFLYHYRNVSGVDAFPAFQPVFEAMVQVRNSRGWLPNMEDSYLRPTPTHLAAAGYRETPTSLHTAAPLSEVLMWSYQNSDLSPFEKESSSTGLNYTGASWDYPLALDELLTHEPAIRATPPDTTPNLFLAGGQSVYRDSWTSRAGRQRYLLFHGVAVADNHNHDDHLSFILQAEGQMMCSDSGYSRGTYAGTERTSWYLTAPAHNTVTFNGKAAGDAAPNRTPPTLFQFALPGLVAEEKEAVFGQAARWRRAILWIADDYYLVSDRVAAVATGTISAFLHGGRGQFEQQAGRRSWSYAKDRYGPAARLHSWIAAPGATVSVRTGEMTYIKGDYAEFPYLETSATGNASAWLTLLKPEAGGEHPAFEVRDLSSSGYSALSVTAQTHRCLAAVQSVSGKPLTIDDVESDGGLVMVRRDPAGRLLAYCVAEATYLRVAGREIWRGAHPQSSAEAFPTSP